MFLDITAERERKRKEKGKARKSLRFFIFMSPEMHDTTNIEYVPAIRFYISILKKRKPIIEKLELKPLMKPL